MGPFAFNDFPQPRWLMGSRGAMPHTTKGPSMTTTTSETVEPTTETAETTAEGATPETELGENGVKALKAERDAKKAAEKDAAELRAQLKAIEDKDKSEAERQQEALEAARAELETITADRNRAQVAADTAIPTALLAGPASTSPEDLAAFADALIAFRGEQKQTPSSSAIGRTNTTADLSDPAQQFAAAIRAATGQ